MEGIKNIVEQDAGSKIKLSSFDMVYGLSHKNPVQKWLIGISIVILIILFLPWTQNIRARGMVTTLRQEQRPQELNTIIAGRIIKWYVREGDQVRAGDTILQLAEIKDDYLDPRLLQRTVDQLEAKKASVSFYRDKATSISGQIIALNQSRDLKLQELGNKIDQQQLKIQSDSMELLAAQNDLSLKTVQYKRQQSLYDSGLVSLLQLEQRNQLLQDAKAKKTSAEIKFNNARNELKRLIVEREGERQDYLEKIAKATAERFQVLSQASSGDGEIAKLQNQYDNYSIRSGQYFLRAPQDGQIVNARRQGLNEIVKEGEILAEIVPLEQQLAVEVFVKPVDIPLLDTGQNVRLVFDGFPAIVFSGWPQASYGIFHGKIKVIENAIRDRGLFRILISETPGQKPWPRELRNGTGVFSIALLKNVPVWYEIWRNINGFPPEYYKNQREGDKKKNP
jgi:multidrug efflux pump subunit AcrA (membrane-fusion protein)